MKITNVKAVFCLLYLVSINVFAMGEDPVNPVDQPTSGYGAEGSFSKATISFTNPYYSREKVYVFYPNGQTNSPTIFFTHGWAGRNPDNYDTFIDHLVSRGFAVVYPTYYNGRPSKASYYPVAYNQMRTGHQEAVLRHSNLLDTTRVGYVGHSLGAGASPRVALDGVAQGWGTNGQFMALLAPYYSFELSNVDLASFPANMKLITVVYEDDDVNDHRMGIDIHDNINVSNSEKDYIKIYSDSNCSYTLQGDHALPATGTNNGETDGYDYYGTWRYIDALADYAWNGSSTGKNVALGNGSTAQKEMGTYNCDGTDVRESEVTDNPSTSIPENFYTNPWGDSLNPRN